MNRKLIGQTFVLSLVCFTVSVNFLTTDAVADDVKEIGLPSGLPAHVAEAPKASSTVRLTV